MSRFRGRSTSLKGTIPPTSLCAPHPRSLRLFVSRFIFIPGFPDIVLLAFLRFAWQLNFRSSSFGSICLFLPSSLSSSHQLHYLLQLSQMRLTSLPHEVGSLVQLTWLDVHPLSSSIRPQYFSYAHSSPFHSNLSQLSHNLLEDLPAEIGALTNLEILNVRLAPTHGPLGQLQ